MHEGNYLRFGMMIATSTIVMFGLMYLNTYQWSHVRFSETRTYMALYMGSAMAIIMLAFMIGMYASKKLNAAILVGSALVFASTLWLLRSQAAIGDEAWMKAMIPHHSIAILTSERAHLTDLRVRGLADEIVSTQREEIAAMEWLLVDIDRNGEATTLEEARSRPAPQLDQTFGRVENSDDDHD